MLKNLLKCIKEEKIWERRAILLSFDVIVMVCAGLLALLTRYEFIWLEIEKQFLRNFFLYLPVHLIVTVGIFWMFRLYHSLWQYASEVEVINVIWACLITMLADVLLIWLMQLYLPRSYYPLSFLYSVFGILCVRFCYRYLRELKNSQRVHENHKENIMVIGAGAAGTMIIDEIIHSSYLNGAVRCIIDDDKNKIGCYIHGIRIVGDRNTILKNVKKYHITQIIVAMPSQSNKTIRGILDICKETNCTLKTLPGVYQLVNGEVQVSQIRDVEIGDLLGREPVLINDEEVKEFLSGKVVLITGGGGSIGSEICRQVAQRNPKQLVLVDIYENNAYDIQQELVRTHPELNLTVLIGSVRNTKRIEDIFATYRPDIVYHAAAHKHVPLMEESPVEAIKNNVLGTFKTVQAASHWGVKRFVMISTDKAVNPTNIMGASKRICEMIIQMYNRNSETEFVAVRFGNVLGSNGSVIPLFKKQIEKGGPVTVTHPDIIRYFMTIPEAVSLVLQAGTYAKGGEIFVLNMGEPVKIVDLAKNLIRLSGLKEGEDIDIVYTGLRPGEKLYEELLMEEEGLLQTDNKQIFIGKPIEFDEEEFRKQLVELRAAAESESRDIRELVRKIVPTYQEEQSLAK